MGKNICHLGIFVSLRIMNIETIPTLLSLPRILKGEVFCFRYPYFYFRHGESTSTASQISKEINKVPFTKP